MYTCVRWIGERGEGYYETCMTYTWWQMTTVCAYPLSTNLDRNTVFVRCLLYFCIPFHATIYFSSLFQFLHIYEDFVSFLLRSLARNVTEHPPSAALGGKTPANAAVIHLGLLVYISRNRRILYHLSNFNSPWLRI